MVALGVASNEQRSAEEIAQFLRINGRRIFARPLFHRIWGLFGIIRAKYPDKGLEKALRQLFVNVRLQDALTDVLIPCFDLVDYKPIYFTRAGYGGEVLVRTAAHASFAASIFFPPVQCEFGEPARRHVLLDAGLFVNDPALLAFIEAIHLFVEADDVFVLSLGTGRMELSSSQLSHRGWGLEQMWGPVQGLLIDGQSDVTRLYLEAIAKARGKGEENLFVRMQPGLAENDCVMDDVSREHLDKLTQVAEQYIKENDSLLTDICGRILERNGAF